MKNSRSILAATDFSEASRPALEEAYRIASESGSRLTLLNVYQIPGAAYVAYAPASVYEDFDRAVRTDAEQRLAQLVAEARSRGIDACGQLKKGFPEDEILACARKEKPDLIIMGTHGRRGLSRFWLGSVASRVIGRSPCPVVTVRGAEVRSQ